MLNTPEEILDYLVNVAKSRKISLNPDEDLVRRIIDGLIRRKKIYGKLYCPCRPVTGSEADSWKVCPCIWLNEEIERQGHCHCGLFVKEE